MPKTAEQRARKRRRERARLHRRHLEALERRREARVTVWFPKAEDLAERPRPSRLDDEILEMQRELLREIE